MQPVPVGTNLSGMFSEHSIIVLFRYLGFRIKCPSWNIPRMLWEQSIRFLPLEPFRMFPECSETVPNGMCTFVAPKNSSRLACNAAIMACGNLVSSTYLPRSSGYASYCGSFLHSGALRRAALVFYSIVLGGAEFGSFFVFLTLHRVRSSFRHLHYPLS